MMSIAILLAFLLPLPLPLKGEKPVNKQEVGSPAFVRTIPLNQTSRSLSSSLQLQVDAFGQQRLLMLLETKQNQLFHPQLQHYLVDFKVGKTTVTSILPQPLRGRWYLSNNKGPAVLYIELYEDGRLRVEGIVDEYLRIASVDSSNGLWKHLAYKRPDAAMSSSKASLLCSSSFASNIAGSQQFYLRSIPSLVQPEVLVVFDYAASKQLNFNFEAAQKYLGVFYASVNQIFATITIPKIVNVITGIVITKNSSAESFVTKDKLSGGVDAALTLPAFGKWLFQQRQTIVENYDVALWSTGLDLGLHKNGSFSSEAVGHAYIGSACHVTDDANYNVGLSEDKVEKFTGIRTHAHELAHLYGAAHDGQHVDNPAGNPGAIHCPWNEGYVMSYQFGNKNSFYFSNCSANQIQYLLKSLRGRCLLNVVEKSTHTPFNFTLPGSFISLDEQCRSRHGQQYFFYQQQSAEVCLKLWCAKVIDNTAVLTTSGPSLEGSPCTHNKRCHRGECQ